MRIVSPNSQNLAYSDLRIVEEFSKSCVYGGGNLETTKTGDQITRNGLGFGMIVKLKVVVQRVKNGVTEPEFRYLEI